MMSAWKLFHNRRTRFGLRNDTVDDIGLDSLPTDGNSYHRTTTDRHRYHLYNSHNGRRDHRQDLDGCNHPPRRIHRHRLLVNILRFGGDTSVVCRTGNKACGWVTLLVNEQQSSSHTVSTRFGSFSTLFEMENSQRSLHGTKAQATKSCHNSFTLQRLGQHVRGLINSSASPSQEHELVQQEQGGNQSPSGSIIDSEDFRSIRRWGATGNDRLPGVVLLARERLLERLRGVHVSENRSSSSSSIPEDDFLFSGNSSTIGPNNDLPEEPISESWPAVMPMPSLTRKHPPGLPQEVLNCLALNVFNSTEDNNESSSASRECSICLEGFQDGDELIHLPCMHRFHSCCLFPWVEVCGACPNCRTAIAVTCDKLVS